MNQSTTDTHPRPFWQTALIAGVLTIGANLVIYYLARALGVVFLMPAPGSTTLSPLAAVQVIIVSLLAIIGAVIAWLLVKRLSSRPARTFMIVALVVLIISFVPDLVLPIDLGTRLSLMLMHVVSFLIIVGIFTRDQ